VGRSRSRILWAFVLAVYFWLLMAPTAYAYMDPGSGSFIFQIVISSLLATGVAVKLFWQRIRGLFIRLFKRGTTTEGP
jgi:hypothetical protein